MLTTDRSLLVVVGGLGRGSHLAAYNNSHGLYCYSKDNKVTLLSLINVCQVELFYNISEMVHSDINEF